MSDTGNDANTDAGTDASTDATLPDGFRIEHEPQLSRFTLLQAHDVVGIAHYTLIGESGIDFDGTRIEPALRGRGLAAKLAHRALTDELVAGRTIRAGCWYMRDYLERHPELRHR